MGTTILSNNNSAFVVSRLKNRRKSSTNEQQKRKISINNNNNNNSDFNRGNYYYKPAPSEVTHRNMRFLITDRPSDVTIQNFIQDWEFPDGQPPPEDVRQKWINLLKEIFVEKPGCCVAVHCVAGLGRAPVMVALALMESGMKYADAVDLIRQHRRGAINTKQMDFLEKYKAHGWLRKRDKECSIICILTGEMFDNNGSNSQSFNESKNGSYLGDKPCTREPLFGSENSETGADISQILEPESEHRRGAINTKQMDFLEKYKAHGWLRKRDKECSIM
uniref:Protein tyrosine phosphatase type IVA 3 n=1 Tax=Romanomermis culicivorax TaxID=13658 RepID=A0A915HS98_ROMCU